MSPPDVDWINRLEVYRNYLWLIAQIRLSPRLRARLNPSDLVQNTLLEAIQAEQQYRGTDERTLKAWLRKILANNLKEATRHGFQSKRDVRVEQSLSQAADRLENALGGNDSAADDRVLDIANALAQLPEGERQVVERRYLDGESLSAIARGLDQDRRAVGRMLAGGTAKLVQCLKGGYR